MTTNQSQQFGKKTDMVDRGILKKHLCNISADHIAINANFHFSHYKSMATVSSYSIQSSFPNGTKRHYSFPLGSRCYMQNLVRIGFVASEEMSFENIEDG